MGRRMMVVAAGIAVGLIVVLAGRGKGEMASGEVRPGPKGRVRCGWSWRTTGSNREVLRVPAGSPVTVEVRNDGDKNHNFTIDSLDVSTAPMHTAT